MHIGSSRAIRLNQQRFITIPDERHLHLLSPDSSSIVPSSRVRLYQPCSGASYFNSVWFATSPTWGGRNDSGRVVGNPSLNRIMEGLPVTRPQFTDFPEGMTQTLQL